MRRLLAAALLLLASGAAWAQLIPPPPARPDALMRGLTAEVMAVLGKDPGDARSAELARVVQERVVPAFDFERMTRSALARNWLIATPEQQRGLTTQFRTLLVRTYSQALLETRGQSIDYHPLRAAPGESDVTVRSSMRRPGVQPLTIDYDMADGAAGWQVYDVKIAGVSLVLAFRDSFAAAVRAGGIDGLLRSLEEKNRENARGADGSVRSRTYASRAGAQDARHGN